MPISQPFIEESISNPGEYYRVQYFERAVLEENPDLAGTPYYVQGRLLRERFDSYAPYRSRICACGKFPMMAHLIA
jgi:hypothetical protein